MNRYKRVGDIPEEEAQSMLLNEDLIPSYNRSKPRFKAFLRMLTDPLEDINDVFSVFYQYFDIDNAIGNQLDIIGALLGVSRTLDFTPVSTSNRKLTDDDYRLVIKSKIASSSWDGTMGSLQEILFDVYRNFTISVSDGDDPCTLVYTIGGTSGITDMQIELMNARMMVPIPSGVQVSFNVTETIQTSTIIVQAGTYQAGNIKIEVISG